MYLLKPFFVLVLLPISSVFALDGSTNRATVGKFRQQPTCGVLAMRIAVQAIGKTCDFDHALNSKYISDPIAGSNTNDLISLARDFKCHATTYSNLDLISLKVAQNPLVLHVTRDSNSKCGGHWVTFLGYDGDLIVMYDSAKRPCLFKMPPAELLTRWSGFAIEVSESPKSFVGKVATSLPTVLQGTLTLLIPFLAIGFLASSHFVCKTRFRRGFALVITSMSMVFMVQLFDENSLFQNAYVSRWQARVETGITEFPDIEEVDHLQLLEGIENGAVIVDSRRSNTSYNFSIPSSVKVGIDFDVTEFYSAVSQLSKEDRIITYCNSSTCLWAKAVACRLKDEGFKDVSVYVGGVESFLAKSNEAKE